MYDILELSKKLLPELKDIAKKLNIKKAESLKKQDLIYKILDQQALEATDSKQATSRERTRFSYAPDIHGFDADSAARRGKRPRTTKPASPRPVESVMSVSPDGTKLTESRPFERQYREEKPECKLNLLLKRKETIIGRRVRMMKAQTRRVAGLKRNIIRSVRNPYQNLLQISKLTARFRFLRRMPLLKIRLQPTISISEISLLSLLLRNQFPNRYI